MVGAIGSLALSGLVLVERAGGWRSFRPLRVWAPLVLALVSFGLALWAADTVSFSPRGTLLDSTHLVLYLALAAIVVSLIEVPLVLRRNVRRHVALLARVEPLLKSQHGTTLDHLSAEELRRLRMDLELVERLLLRYPDESSADQISLTRVRGELERVTNRLTLHHGAYHPGA
jgi:hypothetical protein